MRRAFPSRIQLFPEERQRIRIIVAAVKKGNIISTVFVPCLFISTAILHLAPFSMSESEQNDKVVDRSKGSGERGENGPPPAKRQCKTAARPSKAFVVIHDKEPTEDGDDYTPRGALSFCPATHDTTIIGIFYEYAAAAHAAGEFVRESFEEQGEDEDESLDDPLSKIDWTSDGWFHRDYHLSKGYDDRVHIKQHSIL